MGEIERRLRRLEQEHAQQVPEADARWRALVPRMIAIRQRLEAAGVVVLPARLLAAEVTPLPLDAFEAELTQLERRAAAGCGPLPLSEGE